MDSPDAQGVMFAYIPGSARHLGPASTLESLTGNTTPHMEATYEAPAVLAPTDDSTATSNNVTSTSPKEALTQWIVETLVTEVVSEISAEGLMNRILQSDAAAERVEALTGQFKQKLRAHIEQKAMDELEAEFAGDLEVLNRWPEAEGVSPEPSSETPAEPSLRAQAGDAEPAYKQPDSPATSAADGVPSGPEATFETADDPVAQNESWEGAPPEPTAPQDIGTEDMETDDVPSEDVAPAPLDTPEGQGDEQAFDEQEHTEASKEIEPEPELSNAVAPEQDLAAGDVEDTEDVVEDLVESFGAFPDGPADDAAAAFQTSTDHAIEDTPDAAFPPDSPPDVSHQVEEEGPEAIDEVVDLDGADPDVPDPDVAHEAAAPSEEPVSDEIHHQDQAGEQANEPEAELVAEAAPLHDDADSPNKGADDSFYAGLGDEDIHDATAPDEEPDFSPIDWDAEPDSEAHDSSDPERLTGSLTDDADAPPAEDDDIALDEAFFDGDFFPDIEAPAGGNAADGDLLLDAAVATPHAPAVTVAADEILFARALIGGTAAARVSVRKTFTHATYSLVQGAAYDVLVEAVGVRNDEDRTSADTLAKVLQLFPNTLPIIPLRDPHPAQSMDELRTQVDEVDDTLRNALSEQSAQEAWHMSVLMDKEDVRRYVVDHHAPVREHLQEMRGKPQGVARFIKKKMVETINEEVDRLANECTEAVATLMEEYGNEVTAVAHTPGRDGDYYHLAQLAGLFGPDSEDALVTLTSELVETYGMYGFIFRPEGPHMPRHFPMVFPEVHTGA